MASLQPGTPINRISDVNWGLLLQRLVARGVYMASRAPDIFDGASIEDVVDDVLVEFFAHNDQLGWNPALGNLETFLWAIVRRKVLDRLRRAKRQCSIQEDSIRVAAENGKLLTVEPCSGMHTSDQLEYLRSFARGDSELEALLSAADSVVGPNINQEMAAILHTTSAAISNLKKRLKRKIAAAKRGAAHS